MIWRPRRPSRSVIRRRGGPRRAAWSDAAARLARQRDPAPPPPVALQLFLNAIALALFAALYWLTPARGAAAPACGMEVDRVAP